MTSPLLESLRPRQWTKNLVLLAPLVFARRVLEPGSLLRASLAFVDFCLLASAIYVLNDLLDLERDRLHPTKRHRPIASGRVSKRAAWVTFGVCLTLGLALAVVLSPHLAIHVAPSDPRPVAASRSIAIPSFLSCALLYLLLQMAYGIRLKHVVVLDVMVIAMGFVLRAFGGASVIEVDISHWLLVCTIFLALFLALAKRRHELVLLAGGASGHRATLDEYDQVLLDQLIVVAASASVISYALYTMAPDTVAKFGTDRLSITIPFVIYGLFRYLYLIHRRSDGGDPSSSLFIDRPLLLAVFFWGVAVVLVLYLG